MEFFKQVLPWLLDILIDIYISLCVCLSLSSLVFSTSPKTTSVLCEVRESTCEAVCIQERSKGCFCQSGLQGIFKMFNSLLMVASYISENTRVPVWYGITLIPDWNAQDNCREWVYRFVENVWLWYAIMPRKVTLISYFKRASSIWTWLEID